MVKTLIFFLDQPCLILASCTASFMTSIFFCGTSPVRVKEFQTVLHLLFQMVPKHFLLEFLHNIKYMNHTLFATTFRTQYTFLFVFINSICSFYTELFSIDIIYLKYLIYTTIDISVTFCLN